MDRGSAGDAALPPSGRSTSLPHAKANVTERVAPLAVVGLVAAAFRLIGIDYGGLGADEVFNLELAKASYAFIFFKSSLIEFHPPLFYAFAKLWADVFGDHVVVYRLMAAIPSIVAVFVVYAIAFNVVKGRPARLIAVVAALVFALAYEQIIMAQWARMYAPLTLMCALSLLCLTHIMRRFEDEQNADAGRRGASIWPYLGLAVSLVLTVWMHFVGLVYAACIGVSAAIWWIVAARGRLDVFWRLSVAGGLVAASALPVIWIYLTRTTAIAETHPNADLTYNSLFHLATAVSEAFGAELTTRPYRVELLLRALMFGAWPVLGVIGLFRAREYIRVSGVLAVGAASFGAVVILAAVAISSSAILQPRMLAPAQIGWAILCAFSILAFGRAVRWRLIMAAVMVCVMAIPAIGLALRLNPHGERIDWPQLAGAIASSSDTGGTVYADAFVMITLRHHVEQAAPGRFDFVSWPEELDLAAMAANARNTPTSVMAARGALTDAQLNELNQELNRGGVVWVWLPDYNPNAEIQARIDAVASVLERHGVREPTYTMSWTFRLYHAPVTPNALSE